LGGKERKSLDLEFPKIPDEYLFDLIGEESVCPSIITGLFIFDKISVILSSVECELS
jgi:hypothetical protein